MGDEVILTGPGGVPFDKPERPAPGATAEEWVAYLRAKAAYSDAVSACANLAFAKAFRP